MSKSKKKRSPNRRERAAAWDELLGRALRFTARTISVESLPGRDLVREFARGRNRSGRRHRTSFVEAAKLTPREADVVSGWSALQPTLYRCVELRTSSVRVRNLTTWQELEVSAGRAAALSAFHHVDFGAMLVLPTPDGPVLGGEVRGVRPEARAEDVMAVASNLCREQARLCQRARPDWVRSRVKEEHAAFVSFFGADHVITEDAKGQVSAFRKSFPPRVVDGFGTAYFGLPSSEGTTLILHDEDHGLVLDRSWPHLLDAVRSGDAVVGRHLLSDATVSPAVFGLAHRLHESELDAMLSSVEGKAIRYADAGTELMKRFKPTRWRAKPPLYPVPEVVLQCSRPLPLDRVGMQQLLGLEF